MNDSILEQEFIDNEILHQGMMLQLGKWKNIIDSGNSRVGWKIGFNTVADQARMKIPSPIVGFLTSDRVMKSGDLYKAGHSAKLMVEAEIAILLGEDVFETASKDELNNAIAGFAPAIEIVDVARTSHDVLSILDDNIFHEAVIIGELIKNKPGLSAKDVQAKVIVNDELVQAGEPSRYPDDLTDVIKVVSSTLHKQGEMLKAGDWIISGSITKPYEIFADDNIEVSLSPLGTLSLGIYK